VAGSPFTRYKVGTLAYRRGGPAASAPLRTSRRVSMADRNQPDTRAGERSSERSPVVWLLVVPVVLVLWPPLFNKISPTLFGIPFFYWYQLAVIPIGVICTTIVYRATTRRGGRS
jgi:Protein of unknown function (DUF3311)